LDAGRTRWWWYLGIPVGIAAGALLAVWLRTSHRDALTLDRGTRVDTGFLAHLNPASSPDSPAANDRFLLVVFGYTACPDVCPTTLMAVHRALDALGADAARVVPVFVTVDPERDSPDHLRAYVDGFDPRIRTLSDRPVLAATLRAFRARSERQNASSGGGYSMDHTAVVYVLDPGHRVMAALPESSPTLVRDLVSALRNHRDFHT
jgi:cytochrome oxidase Cu insertion factor (SCO1/SenC/PrrC family)